jgi:hypothetical protein
MWKAYQAGNITVVDTSLATRSDYTAKAKLLARCEIALHIQEELMRRALWTFGKDKKTYATPMCLVLEEAHQFVPSKPTLILQQDLCTLLSISTKEYRKFGFGHLFIDQSFNAIHEDLQMQTFLLGATTQPADLRYVQERFGTEVVSATQRTTGGLKSSWVALGVATPMSNLPWEIESYTENEVSFLAKDSEAKPHTGTVEP